MSEDSIYVGAPLAAAVYLQANTETESPPCKGTAADNSDEAWCAIVSHAILLTPREMPARTDVAGSAAGPEFDAAKAAELLAWMVHGAYVEVPLRGKRGLSIPWMLSMKPPSLSGLLPRLKAWLCARGNEEHDKAQTVSFSPPVSRAKVRLRVSLLVTMGWAPRRVEIFTAFLQGMPIDWGHFVLVRPPPEALVPPFGSGSSRNALTGRWKPPYSGASACTKGCGNYARCALRLITVCSSWLGAAPSFLLSPCARWRFNFRGNGGSRDAL